MSAAVSTRDMSVVLYHIVYHDDRTTFESSSRGTREEVERFIKQPTWPYKRTDSFVGVDDWGHGNVVVATPDLQTHVGSTFRDFKLAAH